MRLCWNGICFCNVDCWRFVCFVAQRIKNNIWTDKIIYFYKYFQFEVYFYKNNLTRDVGFSKKVNKPLKQNTKSCFWNGEASKEVHSFTGSCYLALITSFVFSLKSGDRFVGYSFMFQYSLWHHCNVSKLLKSRHGSIKRYKSIESYFLIGKHSKLSKSLKKLLVQVQFWIKASMPLIGHLKYSPSVSSARLLGNR